MPADAIELPEAPWAVKTNGVRLSQGFSWYLKYPPKSVMVGFMRITKLWLIDLVMVLGWNLKLWTRSDTVCWMYDVYINKLGSLARFCFTKKGGVSFACRALYISLGFGWLTRYEKKSNALFFTKNASTFRAS